MIPGPSSGSQASYYNDIPGFYLKRWQPLVDTLALLYDVPAALIARKNNGNIECIVSSVKGSGPYNAGFTFSSDQDTYCEAVIKSRNELLVENALLDMHWKDSASAGAGMMSYYGLPLLMPDGGIFGALCVLDKKSRSFNDVQKEILGEIKKLIEIDLTGIAESTKSIFFDFVDKFSFLWELFDLGAVDILLFDREGRIVSKGITEPIIKDLRRIISRKDESLHELIVDSYGELIQKKIKEAFSDGKTVSFDLKLTVNEKERDFSFSIGQLFFPYVIVLINDVTLSKKKDKAFIWSEKLKDLILERMPVIVWSTNADLDVSALYGQIISAKGFNPDMFMDRPLAEVLDDLPDREKIIAVHRKVLKGKPTHYEANLYGYDVSAYLEPLYDSDNKIVGTIGVAYDITPQKLAENYYHEVYDKYRLIMEAANEGFWEYDEKSGYVIATPSFFRMLGYEPDEFNLSLKKLRKMLHHDDRREVFRNMRELQQKPNSQFEREIRVLTKGGGWKWFMFRARSTQEEGADGLSRVFGTYTDINARKEAEDDLRESEKKYREIVETANESIVIFDKDLKIIFANTVFQESTGYKEDELIKKSLHELIADEDLPHVKGILDERLKGKGGYAECRFKRKDGSLFWVFTTSRPRLDEEGCFDGMLTMFVDVSEKKKAEDALEQNIKILNDIFETSNEAILSLDSEYRISYVNDKVLEFSGYSREELLNQQVSIFFFDEDLPLINATLKERRKGGLKYDEYRVKLKNGAEKWVVVASKSNLDEEGRFTGMLAMVMDITDRITAENALERSRIRLAEAMDLAHMANWEYDVDTGLFTFDDRFYSLYKTSEDLEGGKLMSAEKYAEEFVHPEDRYLVADEVKKALKATDPGYVSQVEHRIIRRDGEIRNIVVRFGITKDANGRTIKTHGANQDITDRKKAEEALKESEEKYRGVVERISDIIVVFDNNKKLTYVSPSVERVLGYSQDEFQGMRFSQFIAGDSLKTVENNFRKSFNGLAIDTFEIQAIRKDGSIATIEADLRPINMGGTCVGVQAIGHDISERKEIEFELTAQKRLFSSLVSHMPVGVFAKDVKSGHRYTIWNPEFENITGIAAENAIGKTDHELYGDKKGEDVFRDDTRVILLNDIIEQYKSINTESGLKHYFTIKFPGYDAEGSISEIYGLVVDMTGQKELEKNLKSSLEARDLLIKELHHRVKNNLAVISGIISMQINKGDHPSVIGALKDLDGRVQSIAAVHESLYQSASFPMISLKPHLVYLIQSIIASYPPGIPVTYDVLAGDINLKIELAMNLSMVINELVTNSIKHAFSGRKRGHVSVTFMQDGGDCVLIVEDDGIGMPDMDLSKAKSIGFRIVNSIVSNWLKGSAELDTSNGTKWTIRYPRSRRL